MIYAEIAVANETAGADRLFDYAVPEDISGKINIGHRVIVPFGRRSNMTEGYVIRFKEETAVPKSKIKSIARLLDKEPVFSQAMLKTALWMSDRYFYPLAKILGSMLPPALKTRRETILVLDKEPEEECLSTLGADIVGFIEDCGGQADKNTVLSYFGDAAKDEIIILKKDKILCERRFSENRVNEKTERIVTLAGDKEKVDEFLYNSADNKRLEPRRRVVELLIDKAEMTFADIKKLAGVSDSPINALIKDGIITVTIRQVIRNTVNDITAKSKNVVLTDDQKAAADTIAKELNGGKKPVLVYGITGSGKTEVYIKAVKDVVSAGGQAIVLVPEISLTPQMTGRFYAEFGDKVSLTHSRLSAGERIDQWKRAEKGEISVMIGPRSAVFTPFKKLKLIIMDEEHEPSYRCDIPPRFDTAEAAEKICKENNALFVMGSATPSVETYKRALDGGICLCRLDKRPDKATLPHIEIVDMRKELADGNRSMFSRALKNGIKNALDQKRQCILFINRRGFSSFVSCRKCGYVVKCDNCSVSYTYHKSNNTLVCHYCGKRVRMPSVCPKCGSKYIKFFGTGTQKIEQEINAEFPDAATIRMDKDTTAKKHSHERIIEAFADKRADILIGTQMIAKGLNFPGVSLVGVMAADMSLNTGDFRSQERTFELITQVSGRAGRADRDGQVFLQTYEPENFSIRTAAAQDYDTFFDEEIKMRRAMGYPPFKCVYKVSFGGANENKVTETAVNFKDGFGKDENILILGPAPEYISKIKNEYRYAMYITGEFEYVKKALHVVYDALPKNKDVHVYVTALSREIVC